MTNYSFTSGFESNGRFESKERNYSQSNGSSAYQPRMVDPNENGKMISYYMDLCENKRIRMKDITKMTVRELSNEIEKVRTLPYPASDAQIEKIRSLKKELSEIKGEKRRFKEEFLAKLTGGRDGSASKLINDLQAEIKALEDYAKPTPEQLHTLVSWFYCPDIPFEEYGIRKFIYLDEEVQKETEETRTVGCWTYKAQIKVENNHMQAYSTGETELYEEDDVESPPRPMRLFLPDEFAEEVKAKLTKKIANDFIFKYRGTFYEWKQTRITANQMKTIRDIEAELAQFGRPKARESAVDFEGNEFDYSEYRLSDRKVSHDAYTPLSEMQLIQLSTKEATEWINRLHWERDNIALISRENDAREQEEADYFYEKHDKYPERTYTDADQELFDAEKWD